MFRVVNHIGRYTSARKGTCKFLLPRRYLKQWWILGFINFLCPKVTLVYWIFEVHQHALPRCSSTNRQPCLIYLTKDFRRIKLVSWFKSRFITFSLIIVSVILVTSWFMKACVNIKYLTSLSKHHYLMTIRQQKQSLTNSEIK